MKTFTIHGENFSDISGFYGEVNRIFMQGETWQLGESLDAFDDLLYGGFGALANEKEIWLVWRGFEKSKVDLGLQATKDFYLQKLRQPQVYNAEWARQKLAGLEAGTEKTYFEILLEIIAQHPNVRFFPEP